QRLVGPALPRLALPAVGQQRPAAAARQDPTRKPVAVINGEVITQEQLDRMYSNLGTQVRSQYEKNGGKGAFLENYLRKRLIIQEALKAGFDKKADVQADMQSARESALFDRYVLDVVAQPV